MEHQELLNKALTGFANGKDGTCDDWVARALKAEQRVEELEAQLILLEREAETIYTELNRYRYRFGVK